MLNILGSLAVLLLLASCFVDSGAVSAAGTTTISISAPSSLSKGETFNVSINVEPAVAIAGVQFDLSYDATLVTANLVEEGDLLSHNGTIITYFNPGTVDNVTGNVSGVFGTIISPGQTVATPGTFALINLTAGDENGTCPLTLSNVVIGDATANAVDVSVVNSEVTIASGGSPGGGGFPGGGPPPPGTKYLDDMIDEDGIFLVDVIAKSIDGKCVVTFKAGVEGLNKHGEALNYIKILEVEETPAPPEDSSFIGLVYDISPDGATFGPTANLTIIYDGIELPEGITGDELYIAYWDESQWIPLLSAVDDVTKELSARISHFTPFTIIAPPPQVEEPEQSPPPVEPSAPTSVPEPASFTVSDLSVTPSEVKPNEQVTVSTVITNTGGSEGTYTAVLKIDGIEAGSEEVTLRAGESQIVSFTVIRQAAGTFTINVNGIEGLLMVSEEPAETGLVSGLLRMNTQLDIATGKLVLVKINYQFNESRESLSEAELVLQVNLDGNHLETVPVILPGEPGTDGINGSLDYVPSQGWSSGVYAFQMQLYEGDKLLNYTNLEEFEVTPELVAKEIQWAILGVIIECALVVIVFTILVVLHRSYVGSKVVLIDR